MIDQKLRHELEKNPNFELLNNERITPYFIQLSKGSKSEAKMSDITMNDGTPFLTPASQKQFITEFYANIYRKPVNEPQNITGCIEEFLGNDVCSHPAVKGSKIPLNIANSLELPFSL